MSTKLIETFRRIVIGGHGGVPVCDLKQVSRLIIRGPCSNWKGGSILTFKKGKDTKARVYGYNCQKQFRQDLDMAIPDFRAQYKPIQSS